MTKNKRLKERFYFYWGTSFAIAALVYVVLWIVMPSHYVFGMLYRMHLYHYMFPAQYILIPCFFYGIIAAVLSDYFARQHLFMQLLLTAFIILLTVLISCPFGGMLWQLHDMSAGYVPNHWARKLFIEGPRMGLECGWFIVLLSIPYNIIGTVVCFFLTRKGARI